MQPMINKKDVEHIASLARIALTEQEKEKFQKELSAILGFVGALNALDTFEVAPMTGGTLLENSMRQDQQKTLLLEGKSQELVFAAPERREGWVRVKKILEERAAKHI